MITAIYTCIKDEQDYLEDWIDWHLNIGIDKIFIFEDLDSISHRDICNKYPDVSLMPILDLFDDEEKPYVIKMKEEGKYRQTMYAKRGIMYIKNNYPDIDWCFSLDCDEYICSPVPFKSILERYNDLDGVLLRWHNYNASGRVFKPTYDKPIWEIYTTPCGHLKSDEKNGHFTKIAWNLKRLQERYIWGQHTAIGCKTVVAEDLWLNHYFTRSWQEWVYKIHQRGTFSKYRKDDDFFELNPDLLPMKEELLKLKEEWLS